MHRPEWWSRLVELVRLEQTVFALPFAFTGLLLASEGWPSFADLLWVSVAMVGARTTGMSANRLFDQDLDAANPRTADRLLPSGRVKSLSVTLLLCVSLGMFWLATSQLHPTCLKLWPLAVFLLLIYSLLKRITWLCHLGLGMVQACAPLGGWLAVRGELAPGPIFLALAIMLWVTGFDILYACQDEEHDRSTGSSLCLPGLGPPGPSLFRESCTWPPWSACLPADSFLGSGTSISWVSPSFLSCSFGSISCFGLTISLKCSKPFFGPTPW